MYAAAVRPDAVVVVVDKRHQRKAQRHHHIRRRRLQPRNQTHQVRQQDEQPQHRQVARKPLIAVPDICSPCSDDKLVRHLRQVLHRARLLHAQRTRTTMKYSSSSRKTSSSIANAFVIGACGYAGCTCSARSSAVDRRQQGGAFRNRVNKAVSA